MILAPADGTTKDAQPDSLRDRLLEMSVA